MVPAAVHLHAHYVDRMRMAASQNVRDAMHGRRRHHYLLPTVSGLYIECGRAATK